MSKELYMAAHEELIEEYMKSHANCSYAVASDETADKAWDRMRDKYADMIDQAKQRAKDSGNWPPKKAE